MAGGCSGATVSTPGDSWPRAGVETCFQSSFWETGNLCMKLEVTAMQEPMFTEAGVTLAPVPSVLPREAPYVICGDVASRSRTGEHLRLPPSCGFAGPRGARPHRAGRPAQSQGQMSLGTAVTRFGTNQRSQYAPTPPPVPPSAAKACRSNVLYQRSQHPGACSETQDSGSEARVFFFKHRNNGTKTRPNPIQGKIAQPNPTQHSTVQPSAVHATRNSTRPCCLEAPCLFPSSSWTYSP